MQLFQHNYIVNYKNNVLNLVISNDNSLVVIQCSFSLVPIDMTHPPLQINGLNTITFHRLKSLPLDLNCIRTNYEYFSIILIGVPY